VLAKFEDSSLGLKSITVAQLAARLKEESSRLVITCSGPEDSLLQSVASISDANCDQLSWINPNRKDAAQLAEKTKAGALIVSTSFVGDFPGALIITDRPHEAFALSISILHPNTESSIEPKVHSTAIVDVRAVIHPSVSIGPYCVIGACKIGAETEIDSFVRIESNVEIGEACRIESFVSIGGCGFGFYRDADQIPKPVPHIGKIVLGDRVQIFQHSNVDRPTLGVTYIGDDVKIDHHCHIGHNCRVGRGSLIAAGVVTCGGSRVGDFAFVGVGSVVNDSMSIGSGAVVGSGSIITKPVPDRSTWAGNPARPIEELRMHLDTIKKLSRAL